MIITNARRTKRGNISIDVDGEYLMTVREEVWLCSGLFVGGETDAERLNALLEESRFSDAKRRALRMLSQRDYTERQLAERLAQRSGPDAATKAVERMGELGYLDDAGYASRYARELYETKRYALRRIRMELSRKGLARELIDEAVEFIDPGEEEERGAALLEAKFGMLKTDAERRRAAALLERFGYPSEVIRRLLRRNNTFETEELSWD